MINIKRAFKNARLLKSLTGMTQQEFSSLITEFRICFEERREKRGVRVGYGRKHTLRSSAEKLFYILFYIKCYPTFDIASFIFGGVDRARTHEWTNELLPVLRMALGRKIVLPERKIRTIDEFFRKFPEAREVWIDGTERPIQRPRDKKRQKKNYSGKKKRHTVKNLVVTDEKKRILMVSGTAEGKKHDYSIFKKTKLPQNIPKEVKCWLDSGFQGVQKDFPDLNVSMPKRASRGHPLTEEDKVKNKKVSGRRILVENAIGGIKRLKCLTDVYRNRIKGFEDILMVTGAGLWNFHLKMS